MIVSIWLSIDDCLFRGSPSIGRTSSSSPAPSPPSAGSSFRTTRRRWGSILAKYFQTKRPKYFQFIDKKYQAGQRYIYQITKTHKDSFTKVRIINNFNLKSATYRQKEVIYFFF